MRKRNCTFTRIYKRIYQKNSAFFYQNFGRPIPFYRNITHFISIHNTHSIYTHNTHRNDFKLYTFLTILSKKSVEILKISFSLTKKQKDISFFKSNLVFLGLILFDMVFRHISHLPHIFIVFFFLHCSIILFIFFSFS